MKRTEVPAWMPTFADIMTLLMAFFVLLLSLAEIDSVKYRAVAGELKRALGVEVDSEVITLPDGTLDKLLDIADEKTEEAPAAPCEIEAQEVQDELAELYDLVQTRLAKMAADHDLYVQQVDKQIIIRIQEQGVFASGSDRIEPMFLPKIGVVRDMLADVDGGIRVTGHTDDVPIHNGRFRSNWELSSARAVSVVHELLDGGQIAPHRLSAVGYGESRPLAPNTNKEHRARNRRVDIVLTVNADPMPSEIPGPPPAPRPGAAGWVGPPAPGSAPADAAEPGEPPTDR